MTTLAVQKPRFAKLAIAGMAAIAAAVLVNLLTLFILRALFNLPADFLPFTPGPVILFTIFYGFIGWVVYLLINRLARNPERTFLIVAAVALILSFIPNLAAAVNPNSMPMGGAGRDYLILMIFHITAFLAFVFTLRRMVK